MTDDEFNRFCGSLPAATHVVQWGGANVWKVGGKVFAIGGWADDHPAVTFKTNEIAYQMLKEEPGLRPAPYLASRGMKWIQNYAEPGLSDPDLRAYIRESYRMIAEALPKKTKKELGLIDLDLLAFHSVCLPIDAHQFCPSLLKKGAGRLAHRNRCCRLLPGLAPIRRSYDRNT